jgi:YD repeat-containing protein
LTTVSNSTTGTSTSYIYDADGNLLLQIDPTDHHPVPRQRADHPQ